MCTFITCDTIAVSVPLIRAKSTNSAPNKLQTLTMKNTPTPPKPKPRSRYESALVDGMRNLRIKSNSPSLKRYVTVDYVDFMDIDLSFER